MKLPFKIISITGTKGKTSIVRILDFVFANKKKNVLRVDTDGCFVNGKLMENKADSMRIYYLYPTVSPGRFLYHFRNLESEEDRENNVAILESSIGCSRLSGMGYFQHHIGVFTNVYEDHIDNKKIKNKKDIFERKYSFISKIYGKGSYIYNYDDSYLRESRNLMKSTVNLIAITLDKDIKTVKRKLRKEKYIFTLQDGFLGYFYKNKFYKLLDSNKFVYLPSLYTPMLYTLLFVLAVSIAYGLKKKDLQILYSYKFEENGKRMTLFKVKDRYVLLDYAHEKYSLEYLNKYVKTLGIKTTALLRLDYKREDKLIKDTGKYIANFFDKIYIYDKLDRKNAKFAFYRGRKRLAGEVSRILFNTVKKYRKDKKTVYRRLVELEAFDLALKNSEKKSLIIWIVNDIDADLQYLKKLKAKAASFYELRNHKNEK